MAEAQVALGDALMAGNGIALDRDTAVHWYQHAARQSNEAAVGRLRSIGVTLDSVACLAAERC
jgi:TPR repeat protein